MEPSPGSAGQTGQRPFGPEAASILATEHWSLLGSRSLVWSEAMSRTTIFLTVLSAPIVALALAADATGFGSRTTTLALVLLPVVLLLGLATYARLVQINVEEVNTVLAMNRLRHAYLTMVPELEPYFSTGHHDDERGLAATYLLAGPRDLRPWAHFLVTAGAVAFAVVIGVLLPIQRRSLSAIRTTVARFPTPPDG